MRFIVAALVIGITFGAGEAGAKPPEDPKVAEARQHYEAGLARFNLKEYAAAIEEFEAAYRLKPDPVFLFNLAQAYRLGDQPEQALHFYKAYVRTSKTPLYRREVEQWMADLQNVIEAKKAAARPPDNTLTPGDSGGAGTGANGTAGAGGAGGAAAANGAANGAATTTSTAPVEHPVDTRAGRTKKIAGLALAGGGVAALGVGIAFSVLAKQASDKLSHGAQDSMYDLNLDQQGRTDQNVAIAMYVIGGAAIAGGATLFVLGWREARAARRFALVPVVGPSQVGAHAFVRF